MVVHRASQEALNVVIQHGRLMGIGGMELEEGREREGQEGRKEGEQGPGGRASRKKGVKKEVKKLHVSKRDSEVSEPEVVV